MALTPPLDEFEAFDIHRYRELSEVPRAHARYLEQTKVLEKLPLMFVHIPHVLAAGWIETNGLRRINWADEPPLIDNPERAGGPPFERQTPSYGGVPRSCGFCKGGNHECMHRVFLR